MTIPPPQDDLPRLVRWLTRRRFQVIAVVLSTILVVCFGAMSYVLRPYDGMQIELERAGLIVGGTYADGPAAIAGVQPGDRIVAIADRPITRPNLQMYRPGYRAGDVVEVVVARGDETLTFSLTLGRYLDSPVAVGATVGSKSAGIGIWVIGTLLCLFASRRDVGPQLIGLSFLLGAVGTAAAHPPWTCLVAQVVMVVPTISSAVLVLAGHLYFPAPSFGPRTRACVVYVSSIAALLVSGLVILEEMILPLSGGSISDVLGSDAYDIVDTLYLCTFSGIIGLLIRNWIASGDPDVRRQTGVVLWGYVLCLAPYTVVILIRLLSGYTSALLYNYASLAFVFMLAAYAYTIYQRRLLQLDLAINRAVVILVVVLLVLGVSTAALSAITQALNSPMAVAFAGGVMATLVALAAPFLYRAVQRRVDLVLYGSHYDHASVTSAFAKRFARALDPDALARTLLEDLPHQMGIRQVALFFVQDDVLLLHQGFEAAPPAIPLDDALCRAVQENGGPAHATLLWPTLSPETQARWQTLDWGLLFVPLLFEDRLHGLLVLGSRASGDIYSAADARIIGSVAHQAALAHENVRLVESLRGLNRELVRADEAQRKQVARDLHDTVMQQLFFVKQGLFHHKDALGTQIDLLEESIQTLRRTVRGLRPPLLDQGLRVALQGLVDEMEKVTQGAPAIRYRTNVEDCLRLTDEQTTALYRIAQEALSNALKHAQARQVTAALEQAEGTLRLVIADDGVGIAESVHGEREGHYGLAGMRERAAMISAHLDIASAPGKGTRITVEVRL